eukprot:snap_masked-scaffold_16-processed-gene-2.8-mRNA-1 protein AED:0.98 eAED:1.00 QI:0/-1/0/1/-1/1/1/0/850
MFWFSSPIKVTDFYKEKKPLKSHDQLQEKLRSLEEQEEIITESINATKNEIKRIQEENDDQFELVNIFRESLFDTGALQRTKTYVPDSRILPAPLFSMELKADENELINRFTRKDRDEQKKEDEALIRKKLNLSTAEIDQIRSHGNEQSTGTKFVLLNSGLPFGKIKKNASTKKRPRKIVFKSSQEKEECGLCNADEKSLFSPLRKQKLKNDLFASVEKVKTVNEKVKKDILKAKNNLTLQELQSIKTKIFLRNYGLGCLKKLLGNLSRNKMKNAFFLWKKNSAKIKKAETKAEYNRMQASCIVKRIFLIVKIRRSQYAFETWIHFVEHLRQAIYTKHLCKNATIIQCFIRSINAIELVKNIKLKKRMEIERNSATCIQRGYRCHKSRKKGAFLLEIRIVNEAAKRIQQNFKRKKNNRGFFLALEQIRKERSAAIILQCRIRQRNAKKCKRILVEERRQEKAIILQCFARRVISRGRVKKQKHLRWIGQFAVVIQKYVRRLLSQRLVKRLRAEEVKRRRELEVACIKVQRVYRGHEGRKEIKLLEIAIEQKMKEKIKNVIIVQSLVRRKLAKHLVAKRKMEITEEFCSLAREWIEVKDEERNKFKFKNIEKGVFSADPPSIGYTTFEGSLQLKDGRRIKDPEVVMEEERVAKLQKCLECETSPATRICKQCEEVFCNDCFRKIHSKGKYRIHIYEWFQDGNEDVDNPLQGQDGNLTVEADEISQEIEANPWIELFDDASQAPYWSNNVTGETTWFNPYMPSNYYADYYPQAMSQQMYTGVDPTQGQWQQHVDQESMQPFWYNLYTGESTWENPLQQQHVSYWEEHLDEASGMAYYYNSLTGESTWEKPNL